MSRETHRRLSLSRRGLTGVALEAGGRSEHLEETRAESKSYRGCARRGVSFLFSSRFSRYVIGRLKFPPSWKTRAKTSSFYRVGETLLARVKLDNFSFQHCKLFATSSLGGGYLPSSTTLYAVTWTIAFRFIPFFLSSAFSKMSLFAPLRIPRFLYILLAGGREIESGVANIAHEIV